MVKAIRVHAVGGPDVMTFEDVEVPAPKAGEVRIKNHAIGLNYLDVYFRSGAYPAPTLPFVPGNEGAGEVLSLGEGVTGFKVGDRIAYPAPMGSYAEERNIPANALVKLPDAVTYEQAASLMLKGLTAEYLLHRTYKVKPGDTILVHAAAGATGQILVQWGKHLGATVIATVGSEDKGAIAKERGADHVINYRKDDFAKAVKDVTNGTLCDVVYDGVGKDTVMGSLDCLKPFGLLASFGSSSGPADPLNIGILAGKGSLYLTRPTLMTHIADRAVFDEMAKTLFMAVSAGAVQSDVNQRFRLADAVEAHKALEGRQTTGATLLLPG